LCDRISIIERSRLQAEAKVAEDICKRARVLVVVEATAEDQRELERQATHRALHEVISTVYSSHATSYALLIPYLCKQCWLADGENCGHQ
jgi:hypothetical protein